MTPHMPYITLSQVPYTGLALGAFGNAMYFGLLGLWLSLMGYLVVVKKLHHHLGAYLGRTWYSA